MPEFEAFPILEQNIGLFTNRKNWQSPAQSWNRLENFFIEHGRLRSRGGQTLFGTLYPKEEEVQAGTSGLTVVSGTLLQTRVHPAESSPSTYAVTMTDGGVYTAIDDGAGNLIRTDTQAVIGTINYDTGVWSAIWPAVTIANITANYEWERGLAVVGIFDFFPASSSEYLVAHDTKRMYLYSEAQGRFNDISLSDTWTGTDDDYFWYVPFFDRLIFCQGVDEVYSYEPLGSPPHIKVNPTDFDAGSPGNDIDTVQLGVRHKGILHYMYTTENNVSSGVEHPQRARRTLVDDPTGFRDASAFTDAPTSAAIVSAVPVGDSIIVFFERNETWRHRFTGDPRVPYAWERISRERGSWAPFAAIEFDNGAISIDAGGLIWTDGQIVRPLQPDMIEDFPFPVNLDSIETAYGIHYPERIEAWITVPEASRTVPTSVIVVNTTRGVFSQLKFGVNVGVLGFYRNTGTILWDDLAMNWDDNPNTWNSYGQGGVGSVIILGGSRDARVWVLDSGQLDNGASYICRAVSQSLNPFGTVEAHLGYVDFYMKPSPGKIMEISFYRDYRTAAYHTATVNLTATASDGDTIIRRVNVNQISMGHTIEVKLPEGIPGWDFYGMVPYMKPASRIKMRPKVAA